MDAVPIRPYFKAVTDNTVHQVLAANARVRHILWHNDDGAARFMQIFRRLAADVVLGTTVPDLVIQLGADATDVFPFGDTLISPFSFAITTTRGGSTAGTASDVMIALWS